MRFRFAAPSDDGLLAPLNAQLIRDEGHRNCMSISQLAERLSAWLNGEYRAVVFDDVEGVVGYALFRHEPEYTYLRQFFVRPESRRRGIGRNAFLWLWRNAGSQRRVCALMCLWAIHLGRLSGERSALASTASHWNRSHQVRPNLTVNRTRRHMA